MSKEPLLREYQATGYGNNRAEALKEFYRQATILTKRDMVDVCLVPGSELYLPPLGNKLGEFRANFTLLLVDSNLLQKKKKVRISTEKNVDDLVDEIINGK